MTLPNCEIIAKYADITDEQWLALRRTGIGGSEAGGVMEVSKYQSPFSICMEKTGRVQPDDLSDNEAVWYGNWMENKIREELVEPYVLETLGLSVEVLEPEAMYRSKEYPFMVINPDGFMKVAQYINAPEEMKSDKLRSPDKLVGLEIKTGSSYTLKNWKDDSVPDSYYAQVQHYMAGTGLDEWWVFGLIGNQRILRIVKRNEEYIQELIERERNLWELIQKNDHLYFPLPSGMSIEDDYINQLGLPQTEDTADLSEIDDVMTAHSDLSNAIKDMTDEKKRLTQEIKLKLGNCKYGVSDTHKVTFSRFTTERIDSRALKADHPEIVKNYTKTTETGRLTVKEV